MWREKKFLYNLRLDEYRDNRKKEITLQRIASKIDGTGKLNLTNTSSRQINKNKIKEEIEG